jgi:hypothetical protein
MKNKQAAVPLFNPGIADLETEINNNNRFSVLLPGP